MHIYGDRRFKRPDYGKHLFDIREHDFSSVGIDYISIIILDYTFVLILESSVVIWKIC